MMARRADFPPYQLLDLSSDPELSRRAHGTADRTRQLARLYHQTQAHAWNPTEVLDALVARHGAIRLAPEQREAMGQLFSVLLWGELAAWNISTELARWLPSLEARMAATGQAFDEARHFTVLRDYLRQAGVPLPPLNPFGRRLLTRIIDTPSMLQKLYGMQLLVENLALAIFKRLAASRVEPVLTELLGYIERDESRHVALGVLYLPQLVAGASTAERLRNWAFNLEMFLLMLAGGRVLDADLRALGVDHRELALTAQRLHRRVLRDIAEAQGLPAGERLPGFYGLGARQHQAIVDFFNPAHPEALPARQRSAREAVDRLIGLAGRWMG